MQHGLMFHGAQTPWRYGHLTLPAPPLVNGTTAFVGGYGASGLGFGGGGYVAACKCYMHADPRMNWCTDFLPVFQLLSGIPHQYWVILGAFFLPGVIGRLISALRPRIQQAMYAILREYPYHRYGTNARNQSSLGHSQSDSSTRNTSRNPKYRNASTQTDAQPKPMSCNSHQQCYDDLALIKQVVIDNAEEMSNMKKVLLDITEMLKQGNSCGRKAKTYDHTKCWNQLDEMHKVIVRQQETAKKARLSLIGPITIANITPIPTTVDSETVSSSAASVASVVKSRALVLYHQPGRVAWTPAESYKFVSKYTDQVTASRWRLPSTDYRSMSK